MSKAIAVSGAVEIETLITPAAELPNPSSAATLTLAGVDEPALGVKIRPRPSAVSVAVPPIASTT